MSAHSFPERSSPGDKRKGESFIHRRAISRRGLANVEAFLGENDFFSPQRRKREDEEAEIDERKRASRDVERDSKRDRRVWQCQ